MAYGAQVLSDDLAVFCRQVRERSREHQEAMAAAIEHGWSSVAVGILRQELDSMVRAIFLNSQPDVRERARLLTLAVSGQRWTRPTSTGKLAPITDHDMVVHTQSLHDWAEMVYRFGCNFIHLSNCHDYNARDPFQALPYDERRAIAQYLRQYHGGRASPNSTFGDIAEYFPEVFNKVSDNLEHEIRALERGL